MCIRSTPSSQRRPQLLNTRNSANHILMVSALIYTYMRNSYYVVHLCAHVPNVSIGHVCCKGPPSGETSDKQESA